MRNGPAPDGAAGSEEEKVFKARIRRLASLRDLEGHRDPDGPGLGPVRRPERRRRRSTSIVLASRFVAIATTEPEHSPVANEGRFRPGSSAADSTFDTLIYRSNCRVLHAVPAPRKDRGRNRPFRPAGQDD